MNSQRKEAHLEDRNSRQVKHVFMQLPLVPSVLQIMSAAASKLRFLHYYHMIGPPGAFLRLDHESALVSFWHPFDHRAL